MILEIGQLRFIAHNLLSLLFSNCIKLFGFSSIDICDEVSNSPRDSRYLWLWSASLNMTDPHDTA